VKPQIAVSQGRRDWHVTNSRHRQIAVIGIAHQSHKMNAASMAAKMVGRAAGLGT